MLDIGWQELLVIGALALIVVGPKDLPGLLRSIGQWVGKIRGMARDFQRSMNDAAREADLANFKELRDLKSDLGKPLDFKSQAAASESAFKPADSSATPAVEDDPGMVDDTADMTAPGEPSAEAADPQKTAPAKAADS